jgi:DNA topoisomerase IB
VCKTAPPSARDAGLRYVAEVGCRWLSAQEAGRGAAGRKQYIHHQRWRAARDSQKYARLVALGSLLPRVRRRVGHDLTGSRELSYSRVVRNRQTGSPAEFGFQLVTLLHPTRRNPFVDPLTGLRVS